MGRPNNALQLPGSPVTPLAEKTQASRHAARRLRAALDAVPQVPTG